MAVLTLDAAAAPDLGRTPEEEAAASSRIAAARRREHEALQALHRRIQASEERHRRATHRFAELENGLRSGRPPRGG